MTGTGGLRIVAGGEAIAATRSRATTSNLEHAGRRPCVVMTHGFGATQDSGLFGFA
ncbi:hypothetical protein [Nocardioides marmoriginsengisoli]|uniref:hypothetical protein n=1 Tax=Nocardioides marmoriginsengisoli TaxID=661483 RepID=UPI00161B5B48|nr:hypothetical protein [Nocardioides marmoriginsengisoli]